MQGQKHVRLSLPAYALQLVYLPNSFCNTASRLLEHTIGHQILNDRSSWRGPSSNSVNQYLLLDYHFGRK